MSALHRYAKHQLDFGNSWNRADRILYLFEVEHPHRIRLLGENWSTCDTYPDEMRSLLGGLPCPALDAMTKSERRHLCSMPESVDIWRGCYQHNRNGFSWTTEREIAERFPTLDRYHHDDLQPLVLHGRVNLRDILFVKLDRNEMEVVPRPGTVEIIGRQRIQRRVAA